MLLWKSWHIERFRGAKVLKCTALEHRERSIAEVRARTSNESERFHFRQHTICWLCASFFSPLVRVLLYLLWLAVLHACWYWCYSLVACGCVCVYPIYMYIQTCPSRSFYLLQVECARAFDFCTVHFPYAAFPKLGMCE